jgi:hypothetical protein
MEVPIYLLKCKPPPYFIHLHTRGGNGTWLSNKLRELLPTLICSTFFIMNKLPPWATFPKKHRDVSDQNGRFKGRVYYYDPSICLPGWETQPDGTEELVPDYFYCKHWNPAPGYYKLITPHDANSFEYSLDHSGLFPIFPPCLQDKWARAVHKVFATHGTTFCAKIQFCALMDKTCKAHAWSSLLRSPEHSLQWVFCFVCGPFESPDDGTCKRIEFIVKSCIPDAVTCIVGSHYTGHECFGADILHLDDNDEDGDDDAESTDQADVAGG